MRVELRDGQWAELRERITHGQDKAILRAIVAGRNDPLDAMDADTVMARQFVASWNVTDADGTAISLADADALDRAPKDVVDQLVAAVVPLYFGATEANPPTAPSSAD